MSQTPICDRDCFNCRFEDCILDEGPDADEVRQAKLLDQEFGLTDKQKRDQKTRKAYYRKNREKIIAHSKTWYHAHKEYASEKHKEWYWKNRDFVLLKQKKYDRAYYWANRERILARQKAAREAEKAKLAEAKEET